MEKNFEHSFEEHLCTPFWTSFEVISGKKFYNFGEFLGDATSGNNFEEQFWEVTTGLIFPALTNNFFEKTTTLGNIFFGNNFWGSFSSFGAAFDLNFEK